MSNQIIKIFLASSSELKEDREQFRIFISDENDKYIEQGIYLKLILWEKFIDAMSATRLQDEYNKAIRECDVVVSLFKTKVGQYTKEEVMTAYETFKENNKPLIYTYFKEAQINVSEANLEDLKSLQDFKNKLSELGHFYTRYNNIDDLKYKFSDQLIKLSETKKEQAIISQEAVNGSNISNYTQIDLCSSDNVRREMTINYSFQNATFRGEFPDIVNRRNIILESVDGQVPLDSSFYIERGKIESNCYETILESGALIRIKAPCKMGKTSLMSRILYYGIQQGYQKVFIDLWSPELLTDIKTFLQWFCATLSEELNLEVQLEKYWKDYLTNQQNCSKYLNNYIFKEVATPIILGLDNIDEIFDYESIAKEFFKLLRSWHEEGKNNGLWKKLRIVISHSQEIYATSLDLDVNYSPFNVGFDVELGEFDELQIKELIKRHGLNWSDGETQKLIDIIDGHPYLLRVALYYLAKKQLTLDEFLKNAPTEGGLYGDYLYKYLLVLKDNTSIKLAMKKVVESYEAIELDSITAFKLRSLGLVKNKGNKITPICNLYRLYFLDRLKD